MKNLISILFENEFSSFFFICQITYIFLGQMSYMLR